MQESYSDIVLSEEEVSEALRLARREKSIRLNKEAYLEKIRKPVEYPMMNAQQLLEEVIQRGNDFLGDQGKGPLDLDEENMKVYQLLSLYFSNDPRFEDEGYSLRKGIYLFGEIGCGKTLAMHLFSMNTRQSYATIECRDVADAYRDKGDAAILRYQYPIQNSRRDLYYGQRELGYCFDDLGTESKAKNFGNEKNTMEDIFMSWYRQTPAQPMVHFTTNLSTDEIEAFYGARIRSRMREMFNLIEFPSNARDRR